MSFKQLSMSDLEVLMNDSYNRYVAHTQAGNNKAALVEFALYWDFAAEYDLRMKWEIAA